MGDVFQLVADYEPAGDQPKAIEQLVDGFNSGHNHQTLLGVTGSGKTFTIANVIEKLDRPALVLSHNKTLAAQLYSELKAFFPNNAVEYFISYYDYYLPESYTPQTDTYIAKDASVNENIEKLRLAATSSLMERRDVIVVASVSCIYGLGSPKDWREMCVYVETGEFIDRDEFLERLIAIQYTRNDIAPEKGQFRVRGDSVDVFTPQKDEFIRVEFWGDEIEAISKGNIASGNIESSQDKVIFFPCRHFVMPEDRVETGCAKIKAEMTKQVKYLEEHGRLVEAQRLYQRCRYDIEMLTELGYCPGVENYSMHLSDRAPGERPGCLMDFFPEDFITVIDESHVTLPQVRAMYKADRSRKQTLVDHGFRLPSALDNRPLQFDEFHDLAKRTIYISATPGDYELEETGEPIRQVVRPTGLLDPEIEVRPLEGQVDDVIAEIRERAQRDERVIVTTLTKKSSERLSDYLNDLGVRAKYLHSEVDAIQRVKVINDLRHGNCDCLIGINLLREGIDLPEVTLVAILDADKEGFLRSERALLQVAGRAARNSKGKAILYADKVTDSMRSLIEITNERRELQIAHNEKHGITPTTIKKKHSYTIAEAVATDKELMAAEEPAKYGTLGDGTDINDLIDELEREMLEASQAMEFERAADLRDQMKKLMKDLDFSS